MKEKNKKTFIIFFIGLIIGVLGFVSTFIMYINKPKQNKTPSVISNDTNDEILGDLVFERIDESIYLDKVLPTLDKFGVMEKGFSFSIKNNRLTTINYELKLEDDNSTIKNSEVRYQLIKNNEVVGIYTLNDDGVIEKDVIKEHEEVNYTIKIWLNYNSEVKVGRFNKKIAVKEIIDGKENVNKPILTDGMIPVYYDYHTNNWYKAEEDNWYSYKDYKWANAVTVKSEKRKYYKDSLKDTKIEIDDINSMWVWVPRFDYYIYNGEININFVDASKKAYPAFSFNDIELEGFWFSKFESGLDKDGECIKTSLTNKCNNKNNTLYFVPNYPFTTKMTMANMFYAIRRMELKNNIYGFNGTGTVVNNDGTIKNDKNDLDIHMIKNTEWQAVALLTNSKYGINKEIVNNNSGYTGKAYYNSIEYDYNVKDKGELASSTGNVYGIYDLAGGKREYVMIDNSEINIFNKKSNSGFTTKIKEYYYDKDFSENDTTLKFKEKYSKDNLINNEPITRGGYKNSGNIFNLYGPVDYINKISVETNSRACLIILKENN